MSDQASKSRSSANRDLRSDTRHLDGDTAVAEIMRKPVLTVSPEKSVSTARRLMREARIRHLPVVGDDRLLVGIVSDRDLREVANDAIPVGEVMASPVFVISPDTSVRQASRIFRERRFGAMPVLVGRDLVGIVSVLDVIDLLGE
jgi:acetoin utilization protein AcuB